MIFFHNPNEINGYLSNWHMSDFVYKGIKFSCAEQYMMWAKAQLFKDEIIAKKILMTNDCREMKQLGREVHDFNEEIWANLRYTIMYRGLIEKFRQNDKLRVKLLSTGDEILAECAIHDRIWGIGLGMHDDKRFDVSRWRGLNLLGDCLMQVRNDFRNIKVKV